VTSSRFRRCESQTGFRACVKNLYIYEAVQLFGTCRNAHHFYRVRGVRLSRIIIFSSERGTSSTHIFFVSFHLASLPHPHKRPWQLNSGATLQYKRSSPVGAYTRILEVELTETIPGVISLGKPLRFVESCSIHTK